MSEQMLRDDVIIILNEQESSKENLASALEQELKLRKLCCSRISPDKNIINTISLRKPRILVLDFLLGDVGTALDILGNTALQATISADVIIWTDEKNVRIAVESMKLGACDYLDCTATNAVTLIATRIEEQLHLNTQSAEDSATATKETVLPFIADSQTYRAMLTEAKSSLSRNACTILYGPTGCGRDRLAHWLHAERIATKLPRVGLLHTIDARTYPQELASILPNHMQAPELALLSRGATVYIDHVEADDGSLLHHAVQFFASSKNHSSHLVIGTTCPEVAQMWSLLLSIPIIELPPLTERSEDFASLCFTALHWAKAGSRTQQLSPECIRILQSLAWPGDLRQLLAVLCMAEQLHNADSYDGSMDCLHVDSFLDSHTNSLFAAVSERERHFVRICIGLYQRWTQHIDTPVSATSVASALRHARGNMRIAAASLGTTIDKVLFLSEAHINSILPAHNKEALR